MLTPLHVSDIPPHHGGYSGSSIERSKVEANEMMLNRIGNRTDTFGSHATNDIK